MPQNSFKIYIINVLERKNNTIFILKRGYEKVALNSIFKQYIQILLR